MTQHKYCLLLVLWGFSISVQAQKKIESFYAFMNDWTITSNINLATYFMHKVKENDSTYICRYYQKTGPMVKCESYKDDTLTIPNGRFAWYNSDGRLDSTGWVKLGKKDGYWEFRNPNGKIGVTALFKDGSRLWTRNYNTGKILFPDGSVEPLKKDDDDNPIKEKQEDLKAADFAGGVKGWVRFLEKNLRTPTRFTDLMRPNGGRGTVVLCFMVDKDGNIYDPYIDQSVEWSVDMETLRVIKLSPKWTPAYQNGQPVIYRHKQSITHQVSVF